MTVKSDCDPDRQWELAHNGSVEFDSDIVGPGVIGSFIASSVTGLIALIVAFMTYSIPSGFLNGVDGVAARVLRRGFASLRRRLHLADVTKTVDDETCEDRLQAFRTFILSTTDQVLASDLAMLIATFARQIEITLYSVDVVIALGCLACTVHLAMMPLVIDYQRKHHVTKALRSILMLASAIMLVTLLVLQFSDTWQNDTHVYFCCAVRDLQLDVWSDPVGFATRLLVPVVIILGYCEVFMLLYCSDDESAPRKWIDRVNHWTTSLQTISYDARRKWLRYAPRKAAEEIRSFRTQRYYAIFYAEVWAFHECHGSFLWRILWLLSANVYGVTSVLVARSNTRGMPGDRDKMGYGQIVPLVLLVVPLLAAIQGVCDYRDGIQKKRESRPVTKQDKTHESNVAQSMHKAPTPEETTPGIVTSPTLPLPKDSPNQKPRKDTDGTLWQWAYGDKEFSTRPFTRGFVYAHTVFTLAFAVAFGWGVAAGPPEAVWALSAVMLAISARRIAGFIYFAAFARWYREEITELENASNASVDAQGKVSTGKDTN
ncbi:hypothetical protein BJX68DRAFT_266851 [Aspergillus pseudodeflectus]|uniref:Uncharacterized protein n=1 Tax=Aspergillus pseudodeflectus TaxID=176178 RepID=A0ABR4KCN8_9EURO